MTMDHRDKMTKLAKKTRLKITLKVSRCHLSSNHGPSGPHEPHDQICPKDKVIPQNHCQGSSNKYDLPGPHGQEDQVIPQNHSRSVQGSSNDHGPPGPRKQIGPKYKEIPQNHSVSVQGSSSDHGQLGQGLPKGNGPHGPTNQICS